MEMSDLRDFFARAADPGRDNSDPLPAGLDLLTVLCERAEIKRRRLVPLYRVVGWRADQYSALEITVTTHAVTVCELHLSTAAERHFGVLPRFSQRYGFGAAPAPRNRIEMFFAGGHELRIVQVAAERFDNRKMRCIDCTNSGVYSGFARVRRTNKRKRGGSGDLGVTHDHPAEDWRSKPIHKR